jgi:hypothetical protein
MSSVSPERFVLIFSVAISTFGLVTTIVLTLVSPTIVIENFPWRKPIVGLVFASICLFGMIAVLFPEKCSEIFDSQENGELTTMHVKNGNSCAVIQGHHPDCGGFSDHVVSLGKHSLCAACTGLFIGAIMALVGTVFYFFMNWSVGEPVLLTVFVGVTGVVLGFLQLRSKGIVRLALNICFVFGAFLVMTGIDKSVGSVFLDLFLVALIVFWILTRILLSQWDHRRICRRCSYDVRTTKRKEKRVNVSAALRKERQ